MQNLSIQLCTDSAGNLVTKQAHSSQNILHALGIKDFSKLMGVEFLVDVDGQLMKNTIVIKCDLHAEIFEGETTIIPFPKDGTFTYYKFIIPTLSYFHSGWISPDENNANKKIAEYTISSGEIFFCNNSFRLTESSLKGTKSDIIEGSSIVNVDEIWEYQPSSMLSLQKVVFSFCKLQKCLVNLQKQILKNPNNCNGCGKRTGDSNDRYNRDFLLNAIYVLDYLTKNNNYEEAQSIIDNLQDCAGVICKDVELKSDCNCGKTI